MSPLCWDMKDTDIIMYNPDPSGIISDRNE